MKGGCVGHRGFTLGYDYLRLSNACVRLPLFCKVPLENNEDWITQGHPDLMNI